MTSIMSTPLGSELEVGHAIRELRVGRGLSPEQLGARVGLSGQTIRRVEEGKNKPTVRTKFLIALEFGLEVRNLWPA
jgi:DNA-binding XRE family transcriptional regulator